MRVIKLRERKRDCEIKINLKEIKKEVSEIDTRQQREKEIGLIR